MKPDTNRPTCVVGAGFMGRDIAGLLAHAGYRVHLVDVDADVLKQARDYHRNALWTRLENAGLEPARGCIDRISYHESIAEADTENAFFAVEVVTEHLAVKNQVVADLEADLPPDSVIGTNTSSLTAADLARDANRPGRIVLFHFPNPAIERDLVEIAGDAADDGAIETSRTVAEAMNRWVAMLNRERRGNGLSRLSAAVKCAATWELRETSPAAVESAARNVGFETGPIALIDTIGIDVHLATVDNLSEEYGKRFQPPAEIRTKMERMVEANRLGQKSGEGFFTWDAGDPTESEDAAVTGDRSVASEPSIPDTDETADIMPVIAALVNEAHRMVADGIADRKTIDEILRRGSGGDVGPFDLEQTFGATPLLEVLEDRYAETQSPLFHPASSLEDSAD